MLNSLIRGDTQERPELVRAQLQRRPPRLPPTPQSRHSREQRAIWRKWTKSAWTRSRTRCCARVKEIRTARLALRFENLAQSLAVGTTGLDGTTDPLLRSRVKEIRE